MDSILLSVVIIFNLVTATTSEGIPIRAPLRPNALVLPVQKDAATGLHVSKIRKGTPQQSLPFLVDLNGKFLQVNCENGYSSSTYTAPFCHSTICARAGVHYCHRCTAQASRPGCHNNTCAAIVINPLTQKTAVVELAKDVLSIQTITNQSWVDVPKFLFACASSSLLKGPLPRNVEGIVGLGHFSVSFPNQLSSHFGFSPQFSLCFTSSLAKNGAIWFGNVINGVEPRVWASKSPLYTPLYINSQGQYFIQVRAIRINNNPISKPSIFFSRNRGFGGVEAIISTTTPYTILDRSLYQIFSKVFVNAMPGVRPVRPVEPFGLCFDTKNFTSNVPKIHFVMQDQSAKWTIGGAKSLVQAQEGVSCLAFVDGGLMSPRAPIIIIGVHQMEDHLLEFDLARSRLGFSPPRFFNHKTCAHFNFTSTLSP